MRKGLGTGPLIYHVKERDRHYALFGQNTKPFWLTNWNKQCSLPDHREWTMSQEMDDPRYPSRWRKGVSGNPAGRPRGARNKATMEAQALLEGEVGPLTRKAIGAALDGCQTTSGTDPLAP
jgi:hypothetical protein